MQICFSSIFLHNIKQWDANVNVICVLLQLWFLVCCVFGLGFSGFVVCFCFFVGLFLLGLFLFVCFACGVCFFVCVYFLFFS